MYALQERFPSRTILSTRCFFPPAPLSHPCRAPSIHPPSSDLLVLLSLPPVLCHNHPLLISYMETFVTCAPPTPSPALGASHPRFPFVNHIPSLFTHYWTLPCELITVLCFIRRAHVRILAHARLSGTACGPQQATPVRSRVAGDGAAPILR